MGEVRPIPTLGGVVRDVRGTERALRVSWHREDELVVLSLWNGPRCTGTVRVAAADVPTLIEALQIGLRSQSDQSDQLPAGAAPTDTAPAGAAPADADPADAASRNGAPTDESGTAGRVVDDREDGVAG
jgi:hypothetical protein